MLLVNIKTYIKLDLLNTATATVPLFPPFDKQIQVPLCFDSSLRIVRSFSVPLCPVLKTELLLAIIPSGVFHPTNVSLPVTLHRRIRLEPFSPEALLLPTVTVDTTKTEPYKESINQQ